MKLYRFMKRSLKLLDDTIVEIEEEIEKNPNEFLISTLERLKIYRENEIKSMIKNAHIESPMREVEPRGGFRGIGVC